MSSSELTLAVAIPAYKRPDYLKALIATVPSHISVYVSDNDGSLKGQMGGLRDNVHVKHMDRLLPIFANWNNALSLVPAAATHVVMPSDDDLFTDGAFGIIESTLAAHPDTDIFIFGCNFIDEHGQCRPGYLPERLERFDAGQGFLKFYSGVQARMPGIVFKRSFLQHIGGLDERFKLTAADSELIQRALLSGRSLFVPHAIGSYRIWAGGLTHLRQATDEWMQEISLWGDKIAEIMRAKPGTQFQGYNTQRFKHDLIALNLLSGLGGLIDRNEFEKAQEFFHQHGIPRHASWGVKLQLVRMLVKARLRRLTNA